MAAIFQTTFSNALSWMKMCWFRLIFHWSLFTRVKLTIFQQCRDADLMWLHWNSITTPQWSHVRLRYTVSFVCPVWPAFISCQYLPCYMGCRIYTYCTYMYRHILCHTESTGFILCICGTKISRILSKYHARVLPWRWKINPKYHKLF